MDIKDLMVDKRLILVLTLVLASTWCKLPRNFSFGTATAAYQIEGAWLEDGKGMHIWDNMAHAGFAMDNSTGDIAADSYHRYHEDIALLQSHNIKHFRMSISWARILPYGRAQSQVNAKGIAHYRKQFKALLEAGITPYVTLYHWDLPAFLVILGKGYVDPDFPEDFEYYADVCFQAFGDLVKNWFTFNEPWCTTVLTNFQEADAPTKPYLVAHNILLAHGRAVKVYREKYQSVQRGLIGMVINSEFYYPKDSNNTDDVEAAKRCLAFQLGWFAEPIFKGDYPAVMKERVGDRLPEFTSAEKAMLNGSADFFALNNYFSCIAEQPAHPPYNNISYWEDRYVDTSYSPEWNLTDNGWPIVPQGMHDLLVYIQNQYLNRTIKPIFITENGVVIDEESIKDADRDHKRIDFVTKHLNAVEKAITEGVNVTHYFYWSLVDDFEWGGGYQARFGLTRVEFGENVKRIPRKSFNWYSDIIRMQQH